MTPASLRSIAVVGALLVVAGCTASSTSQGASTSTSGPVTSATTGPPSPPIRVTSVLPAAGDASVPGLSDIRVTFSGPVSSSSPMPTLSPSQSGTWSLSGSRSVVFVPSLPYVPLTRLTLVVPSGGAGVRGVDGAHLADSVVDSFRVADGSTRRLQQLLSLLDYSPLSFRATGPATSVSDAAAEREALFVPPAGVFTWRRHGWPRQLTSLWHAGSYDVMTKGLVMEFEADHGLVTNGTTSAALWQSLLEALAAGDVNTGGYNYALANQAAPESLTIWHDAAVALHVPANTGIAQAPTADGNFPVFSRLRRQVMRGTNPDGTTYADPVQFVAYFNGGDAVHYIPRSSYGIPQSLGCVELNLQDASEAWPYLAYGTIVSVVN